MGIIAWIVLGLIAGAVAKLVMPGNDPGGFIGTQLGFGTVTGFNLPSIGIAILGALVLLLLLRLLRRS